jgi:hypothetical protein
VTFKVAFGIAIVMVVIAAINKHATAGLFALVLLYLLLAALLPWLMVPVGIALVLVEILSSGNIIAWIQSFHG